MYHGHYFRLDTDITSIEKGVTVFRYCPDGKADSDIYVTFSDDEIEFNSIGGDTNRNATILCIPVDENIDRSFADTVTEAYHWEVEEVTTNPQELSHLSYYSTFYFGRNSKHLKYWKKPRSSKRIYGSLSIPEPLSVRKIILDFLFDLHETRVFQMSPHYGELTEKLRMNFFARCLIAKARYWYHRAAYQEILDEHKRPSVVNVRKTWKNKKQFYGKILLEAEREWAECIRDTQSDKTFHDEFYDWFDDSETEMLRIYKSCQAVELDRGVIKDIKQEHDKQNSKWFVARHTGLTAWRIFFEGHWSFFGIHLFWPRMLFSVGTAWFTLKFIENAALPKGFLKGLDLFPFISLIFALIFIVSLIVIRRIVPFVKGVYFRAFKLSCLVILISSLVGRILLQTTHEPFPEYHEFLFLWISAAFVGLVLQIILQGDNPSEPL